MNITPAGAVPSRRMSPDYFTGTVWQDPIIEAPAPARIRAALVTFEPGARTAWHTHPLGQTLHVDARHRPGADLGRPDPRDPRRRHGVDSARREALARRRPDHGDGPHRHAGGASTASLWSGWSTSPTRNTRARAGDGERDLLEEFRAGIGNEAVAIRHLDGR